MFTNPFCNLLRPESVQICKFIKASLFNKFVRPSEADYFRVFAAELSGKMNSETAGDIVILKCNKKRDIFIIRAKIKRLYNFNTYKSRVNALAL